MIQLGSKRANYFQIFGCKETQTSRWPRGLTRGSSIARLLGLRFRIPLRAWMFVSFERCMLSLLRADHSPRGDILIAVCPMSVNTKPRKGGHYLETGRSATEINKMSLFT
jgi:hypothetical protein